MTDWRQRLRDIIKRKGYKHYLVAEDAGITNVTLSRTLTDPRSNPYLSTIVHIAHAVDEPVGAVLGEPLLSTTDAEELQAAISVIERLLARGAK